MLIFCLARRRLSATFQATLNAPPSSALSLEKLLDALAAAAKALARSALPLPCFTSRAVHAYKCRAVHAYKCRAVHACTCRA
eukprot:3155119-Pleurochrysis_carterae.AAC.1